MTHPALGGGHSFFTPGTLYFVTLPWMFKEERRLTSQITGRKHNFITRSGDSGETASWFTEELFPVFPPLPSDRPSRGDKNRVLTQHLHIPIAHKRLMLAGLSGMFDQRGRRITLVCLIMSLTDVNLRSSRLTRRTETQVSSGNPTRTPLTARSLQKWPCGGKYSLKLLD